MEEMLRLSEGKRKVPVIVVDGKELPGAVMFREYGAFQARMFGAVSSSPGLVTGLHQSIPALARLEPCMYGLHEYGSSSHGAGYS